MYIKQILKSSVTHKIFHLNNTLIIISHGHNFQYKYKLKKLFLQDVEKLKSTKMQF